MSTTHDPFASRADGFATANRSNRRARQAERAKLLAAAPLAPGQTILDLQAGGGYIAEGVLELLRGAARVVSVEPSASLASTLPSSLRPLRAELGALPLATMSADVVLCLAGTHHSPSPLHSIAAEMYRVLRPGGAVSLCEVERGSPTGGWLDDFVDRHCKDGHKGRFVEAGALESALVGAGFEGARECRESVPWVFADEESMVDFCTAIFGLQGTPPATVRRGLEEHLAIGETAEGQVELGWELCFAAARRPRLPVTR